MHDAYIRTVDADVYTYTTLYSIYSDKSQCSERKNLCMFSTGLLQHVKLLFNVVTAAEQVSVYKSGTWLLMAHKTSLP